MSPELTPIEHYQMLMSLCGVCVGVVCTFATIAFLIGAYRAKAGEERGSVVFFAFIAAVPAALMLSINVPAYLEPRGKIESEIRR